MAGLYVHIPFCKRACTYCDFHFSTSLGQRDRVMAAILKEIAMRAPGSNGARLGSIYLGGGSPSVVGARALENLLRTIAKHFTITGGAEVTIEANPDDVTADVLRRWKDLGITRVSLGIQSFRDERLTWMGRAHDAGQARRSIELLSTADFASWTIDLIYGLPDMTTEEWDEQLTFALDHGMPHLSAYCLTVEKGTALEHQVRKGQVTPVADDAQAAQFDHLVARMESAGLVQYEISNFGREGHFAAHNSSYWKGVPYVGVGPSAHSFDGTVRRWNVANNVRYAEALETDDRFWEEETLSHSQRVNERLMTGLRTIWGVDLIALGDDVLAREKRTIEKYRELGDLFISQDRLLLTPKGRRYADRIASDLFLTGDDARH